MYEKMLEKVMSNNVTLQDWQRFCNYIQTLPGVSLADLQGWLPEKGQQQTNKKCQDFVDAAYHVAGQLPLKQIIKDPSLTLAYIYQNFS